jgi:hypothetical protein
MRGEERNERRGIRKNDRICMQKACIANDR